MDLSGEGLDAEALERLFCSDKDVSTPGSASQQLLGGMSRLVMHAAQPTWLFWGGLQSPQLLLNRAAQTLASSPDRLGDPQQLWPEAWAALQAPIDELLSGRPGRCLPLVLAGDEADAPGLSLSLSLNPVHAANGRVLGVMGVILSSQRTHLPGRPVDNRYCQTCSEVGFRELANLGPALVWLAEPGGSLRYVNPRFCSYTGRSEAELLRLGWHVLLHPREVTRVLHAWRLAMRQAKTFEVEARLRGQDDSYHWFLIRAVPRLGSDGQVQAWLGCNTDIHLRKESERQLQSERDRFWNLSPNLLLVLRADGAIEAANPAWTRLLGYDESALLEVCLEDLVHPDDQSLLQRQLATPGTLEIEDPDPLPIRLLHRDGSSRLIVWSVVADQDHLHLIGRDVTAERAAREALGRAESALQQARKMDAIGQLTGSIAQDFNQLLQGMLKAIDALQGHIRQPSPDPAELVRCTDSALNSVRRAAALTRQLLSFARRQLLHPTPVVLNVQIISMQDLLAHALGAEIALELSLAEDLCEVCCDAGQLEIALLNLTINARDAMPEGGLVSVQTENRVLSAADLGQLGGTDLQPGTYACLQFHDTGRGMPPEVQKQAFEPFFTTKPLGEGSGLGLSMVYALARQSHGLVTLDSMPGLGTSVTLYLPALTDDRSCCNAGGALSGELLDAVLHDPGVRPGLMVLVVDYQPLMRQSCCDLLREQGCEVLEAAGGEEGLQLLQSALPIALVVTSRRLPGIDGQAMVEQARRQRPGLRALYLDVAGAEGVRPVVLQPHECQLNRPFTRAELLEQLRTLLDGLEAS